MERNIEIRLRIAAIEGEIARRDPFPASGMGYLDADIRALKAERESLRQSLRELEGGPDHAEPDHSPGAIQWKGNNADFAAIVLTLWRKGYIGGDSDTDVLRVAAAHFKGVNKDAKTLKQGFANRRDYSSRDFDCIPEAKKPPRKKVREA